MEASALPKSPLIVALTTFTLTPRNLASRPNAKLDVTSPSVIFPSYKSLTVIARLIPGIIIAAALAIGVIKLVKSVAETMLSTVWPGSLVKRPVTPATGVLTEVKLFALTPVMFPSPTA